MGLLGLIIGSLVARKEFNDVVSYCGSMPNIPTPTMGGTVFWEDIASHSGWRVQRNILTGHCRLLDPYDVRHGWGTANEMYNLLKMYAH